MQAILFVCLGNICRSPAAEGVMRALAPHLTLDSAGTGDWHQGDPPYGPMQSAARARGYDLSPLRARQIRPDDFHRFDLIVAMDAQNRTDIEALRPQGAQTPVVMFREDGGDVPDPYFTRDFETCLDIVEDAAQALIRRSTAPRE